VGVRHGRFSLCHDKCAPHVLTMYIQTFALAALATCALGAVSNPHHKAQQHARPKVVARAPEPRRLDKRASSPFLTNKTERK
jgi:hypothetical protein